MADKYVKQSIEVEAIQWTGNNTKEIKDFVNPIAEYLEDENVIVIPTLEGDMKAKLGDYIIKGVKGEFYPCNKDIFEKTYKKIINTVTKPFDLFIVECDKPSMSFDYIAEEIARQFGNYINITFLAKDDNSCFCRNFVPGSISLITYLYGSSSIKTGYQKAQTANNGICLFSYNLSSEYKPTFEHVDCEDDIIDRIINAFYSGIAIAKAMDYDIIGDGYKLITAKFREVRNNL